MMLLNIIRAIIEQEFFRNAFIASILIGFILPLIGSVVVIRRLSNIADTLSHFALAGVVIGVFISKLINLPFPPMFMGIIFSIGGTFIIEKIRTFYKNYKELSLAILISLGVALTGIFIYITEGISTSTTIGLLFGSILAVGKSDILVILIFAAGTFTFIALFYRQIITLSFDETYARIAGINVKAFQLAITIILALAISIFIEFVGVLLISALLIIPTSSSILVGKSFKGTIYFSIAISLFSIFTGFLMSFYFNFPLGSIIALTNIAVLFVVFIIIKIKDIKYKRKDKSQLPNS